MVNACPLAGWLLLLRCHQVQRFPGTALCGLNESTAWRWRPGGALARRDSEMAHEHRDTVLGTLIGPASAAAVSATTLHRDAADRRGLHRFTHRRALLRFAHCRAGRRRNARWRAMADDACGAADEHSSCSSRPLP